MKEFELIDWINQQPQGKGRVTLGIGDDAAEIDIRSSERCLLASDMILDGTHFRAEKDDAKAIGRKALAINLSDIAAMGGRPREACVNLALPRSGGDPAKGIMTGLFELAREFEVTVVGGDVNRWNGPLAISVTVTGACEGPAVRRDGAQPGDWIFVTGHLGGSLAGRHFTFTPRIREALALRESFSLHAMIDISDGLASDLGHILHQSHGGAELDPERIPVSAEVDLRASRDERLRHALCDGEDFELCFTVSAEDGRNLQEKLPLFSEAPPITYIGTVTNEPGLRFTGGYVPSFSLAGYEH